MNGNASDLPEPVVGISVATGGAYGYRITQSRPDELKRHDISDEELTMLTSGESRSFEQDIFWVALGALVAAIPASFSGAHTWYADPSAFSAVDFATCMIFAGAVCACIVTGVILRRRPKKTPSAELAQAIRERTAREVS